MARVFGWLGWGFAVLLGLALVLLGGAYYALVHTQPGHDRVLEFALEQLHEHVDGRVEVDAIGSDGLLRGVALYGVRIRDSEGRPFAQIDSLEAGYRLRDVLRMQVRLEPVEVWGAQVILEQLPEHDRLNAERIFQPDPPPDDEDDDPDDRLRVAFRDVGLNDVDLEIRLPADPDERRDERLVVEPYPELEGAYMERYSFRGIHASVPDADIIEPGRDGERFRVETLSTDAEILREGAIDLRDFSGEVRRQEDLVDVVARELRLANTRIGGEVRVDYADPVELDVDVSIPELALSDFHWAEPDLPDIRGSLHLTGRGPAVEGVWDARDAELELDGSRVVGDGGLALGEPLSLRDVDVRLEPLALSALEPWLEEGSLPVEGLTWGEVRADGALGDLTTSGALTLTDWAEESRPVTLSLNGRLHLEAPLGASDLTVLVDPLDYRILGRFHEELAPLRGEGRLFVEGGGRWGDVVEFQGDALHGDADLPRSEVSLEGEVRGAGDDLQVDLEAMLEPLSLTSLTAFYPEASLQGDVSGSLGLSGRLDDLESRVVLSTPGGPFQGRARFDVADPGAHYEVEASVRDFALDRFVTAVPDGTVLTGEVSGTGEGFDPGSMVADAMLSLGASRVGEVDVDSLNARVGVAGGRLDLADFSLGSALVDLSGRGDLAMTEEVPSGNLELEWQAESLAGLRVLATGEAPVAQDTLTPLEEDILRWDGIEPDTLPAEASAAWDGRASGSATVSGSLESFSVEGVMGVEDAFLGEHSFRRAHLEFSARELPRAEWRGEAAVEVDSVDAFGWRFQRVTADGGFGGSGEGHGRLRVERDEVEEYRAAGDLRVDEEGGRVTLEELHARFPDFPDWGLDGPAGFRWSAQGLEVEDLRLSRGGEEPMHLRAHGFLPREGTADFQAEVEGLRLGQLSHVSQWDREVQGVVGLELGVGGTALAPEIEGTVVVDDFSYEGMAMSRLHGAFDYADGRLGGRLEAADDGRGVFRGDGSVAADLAFRPVEERFPDEAMALRLQADSVPAAFPLALVEETQDIQGFVDGEIRVGGTPSGPEPEGTLRLRDGAASLPALGIRPARVRMELEMTPDQTMKVSGEAHSHGVAEIGGTVDLSEVTDPGFDLEVNARSFQALNRPDLSARLGGRVSLLGRYSRPEVTGDLEVDQGTIQLEEFQRAADVVDLTDPAFFDVVDTTVVATRPVVASVQNPFVQNLRVEVDVAAQRDVWLRSRDMNVEMGGDLIVTFDRPQGELVLTGGLEAIRGSYTAFGRNFQVREGQVEFPGTPGLDPTLDIEAVNRLRREGGEPLDVIARVEGTLMNPRVSLTSDSEPPIAQSDLISYLIFGRPSYALGRGETSILEGAAGAGVTMGLGTLATQLGTIFAQEVGLDYIAITQQTGLGLLEGQWGGFGGQFAETQVEVGQYLGQDVFVAVMFRPLTGLGTGTQTQFPGARIEWRFADHWTAEAFVEDRFAREGMTGFGELGINLSRVLGMSIFREWSY